MWYEWNPILGITFIIKRAPTFVRIPLTAPEGIVTKSPPFNIFTYSPQIFRLGSDKTLYAVRKLIYFEQ